MSRALTGQKTVSSAGSAEALGTQTINTAVLIKALDTNTDVVVVGNDGAGDVTLSNGMRLEPGDCIVMEFVGNLSALMVDAAVNGEGVCWMALNA
jgi:hypothetical protein